MKIHRAKILLILGLLFLFPGCFPKSGYKTLERIANEEKEEKSEEDKKEEEKEEEKAKGRLFIITDPSFADVYVDHSYKGKSPLEIELEEGSYEIKTELEGYYPAFATVWVDPEEKLTYYFSLEEIRYAEIEIECNVDSARVYIDGKYRGIVPGVIKKVPTKSEVLEVKRFGYETFLISLALEEGERLMVDVELRPKPLRIEKVGVKPSFLAAKAPPFAQEPTIVLKLSRPARVDIKIMDEVKGETYTLFSDKPIKKEVSKFKWKPERIEREDIYRILAIAKDSSKEVKEETQIRVDPFTRWRSEGGIDGSSGLLLCPVARTIGTTTLGISGRFLSTKATDGKNSITNLLSSISLIGSFKERTEFRLSYFNLTIPPTPATDTLWVSNSLVGLSLHQVLFKNPLFGSFATGIAYNTGNIKSYNLRGLKNYWVYSKDIFPLSLHIGGEIRPEIVGNSLYWQPGIRGGLELPVGKNLLFELSINRTFRENPEKLFIGLEGRYLLPSYPLNFGFSVLGYTEEGGEYLLFYGIGIEIQWFR